MLSAKALNAEILKTLREHQIYRIDHFLGKETVQNVMALRFANGLFEPLWNREHIDHIQITAAETVGVERRGEFYEKTGALRDMVPNHLFQLLSLTAMEPPISFDADAVRAKKVEVIRGHPSAVARRRASKDAVRGQYDAGTVSANRSRPIAESPTWRPDSTTETYIACKLRSTTGAGPACRSTCAPANTEAPADRNRHPLHQAPFASSAVPMWSGHESQLDDPAHPARGGHRRCSSPPSVPARS